MQANTDLRRNRFAILARLGLVLALLFILPAQPIVTATVSAAISDAALASALSAAAPAAPTAAAALLQFTAGGHVVGFGPTQVVVAGLDHALRIQFVGAAGVTPVAAANSVAGYGSDSKIKTIVAGATNTQDLSLLPTDGGLDFGDLPSPYKTLLADNGPRHSIVSGAPYLGAVAPDAETDGQPNATATGDDSNGVDDEEGVAPASGRAGTGRWTNGTVFGGQGGAVSLTISGASACLGAFMDFNSSGTLAAVSLRDLMGNGIMQPIAAGAYTFYFNVPDGTFTGSGGNKTIYSLFRVTSPVSGGCAGSTANSATGAAAGGEVDGYAWGFTPNALTLTSFRAISPSFDLAAWLADLLRRLGR